MKLQRFINESNEIGEFNIYKFVINSSVADLINGQNSRPQIIHDTEKEASNVKVSNVGGTHGYPTLFKASLTSLIKFPLRDFVSFMMSC